jgi:hypothetical protein
VPNRLNTLKWTWRKKMYLYVNPTTQRCPNKIFKTSPIKDFLRLPLMSMSTVVHLDAANTVSPQIFWKIFETALMGYSEAWGKLIHEKTWSRKNLVALSLKTYRGKSRVLHAVLRTSPLTDSSVSSDDCFIPVSLATWGYIDKSSVVFQSLALIEQRHLCWISWEGSLELPQCA